MSRPIKPVKFKRDHASGVIYVSFAECPDHYFASSLRIIDPINLKSAEHQRIISSALAWARRNKPRLLSKPDSAPLIRDLAKGFFDEDGEWYADQLKKGRRMTRASLRIRRGQLNNYVIPLFGDLQPAALTQVEIDQAVLDLARKGGEPLTRGTKSKLLYTIKLLYDRWVYLGYVTANPTAGIVKYSKAPERPRSRLPDDVIEKLFPPTHGAMVRVWGGSLWASMMLVLLDTGARPGEARAARWVEYYPEERFWPIRTGVEAGTTATIKGTKTDAVKPGFLQARTVQELAIWRAESNYNRDDDFIFTISGRAPVTPEAVGQAFARALSKLGYDATGWTPYWIRHTFVTRALRVLDDDEVMMLAGHTSMVTNAIYRHPDDAIIRERSRGIQDKLDKARQ